MQQEEIYLPTTLIIEGLHDAALDVSGGAPGILHHDMLKGAVERPKTYMSYSDAYELHTVCALLLDSLARHHTFNDGNKRTALMTVIFTYRVNSVYLDLSLFMNKDYEKLVLWVVKEKPSIDEIVQKLTKLTVKYQKTGIDKGLEVLKDLVRKSTGL
jgi:death on curing protein